MTDYPSNGQTAGALAFVFVRKLCESLERNNTLPAGEAARIWADIAREFKDDTRNLVLSGVSMIHDLRLAKK